VLVLLNDGWAAERVAVMLFIGSETVCECRRLYEAFGFVQALRRWPAPATLWSMFRHTRT
jgi:hypothetical protein